MGATVIVIPGEGPDLMYFYSWNKPLWAILGVPLLVLGAALLLGGSSDRDKYDRLEVGMSAQEVHDIIDPPAGGKYAHLKKRDVRDNETLHLNDRMVLTIRNGRLVDKKWVEKK